MDRPFDGDPLGWPRALADLHDRTAVGDVVDLAPPTVAPPVPLSDLLVGGGFEPLDGGRARRLRPLADTVGPDLRVLVVGLNPSLHAADAGVGYVTPGNRFWPAALAAGLVTVDRDPRAALEAGVGMTDLVKRATPRAAELDREEYRTGYARLDRLVRWLQPGVVCFVGLGGYRAAVDRHARPGPQSVTIGGRPVHLMPSTSGLNARTDLATFVRHLRSSIGR